MPMCFTRKYTRKDGSKFELEVTIFNDRLADSLARTMNQSGRTVSKKCDGGVVAVLRPAAS